MNILLNLVVVVLVVRSGDSRIFMNLIQVQNVHYYTHFRDFPTFTSQAALPEMWVLVAVFILVVCRK